MDKNKEVIKDKKVSKVKSYNIELKNIAKVDKIANKEYNGNSSKSINKIIEDY